MSQNVIPEICRTCRKPKSDAAVSSITQWIAFCQCDVIKFADDDSSKNRARCKNCRKYIRQHQAGSMTQWIFSTNDCLCKMPFTANSGEEKSSERTNQIAAFNFDDPFEGEEIFVESDSFPLDRYRAVRLLGKGTLGEVFLGIDRTLRKPVAIKCLLNVTNQRAISFQNEAKIANKLHHPCLIDVLDFGITSGGRPFMVMEYFDGISLEQLFLEARAISEEVVLCLFTNICDGLGYMHDHGVFHRDLKPSNVLVSISDTMSIAVKIIDFGLAKTTQDLQWKTTVQGKTIVGTPAYMSPDQALGQAFSAASEVYSLGCMLFESLCGRPPFEGETALETINQHV